MTDLRVAALPMYDFADVREAHDELWGALAVRLSALGVTDVPPTLTRDVLHTDTWRDPRLLFGQACEYPLATSHAGLVRLVATPRYAVAGCEGTLYRSAIIVRMRDPARTLLGIKGRRCAVNDPESNSGMNLLRAAIAPVADGGRYFDTVVISGSHRASAHMVVDEVADVAAIDCVTYAHLARNEPLLVAGLRVLAWTPPSRSLPYVTALGTDNRTVEALRAALHSLFFDPALRAARDAVFLAGVDVAPDQGMAMTVDLARRSVELQYPHLC